MKHRYVFPALIALPLILPGCSLGFIATTDSTIPPPPISSLSSAVPATISIPVTSLPTSEPKPSEIPSSPAAIAAASTKLAPDSEQWNLHLVNLRHPLPDDYAPALEEIENGYYFDARAAANLRDMLAAASEDGIAIYVTSAYRSMGYQQSIYEEEIQLYRNLGYNEDEAVLLGSSYVAYPGTSEHQLGLATDLISPDFPWLEEAFEDTEAFAWLSENAADFGFVLRYPKDKTEITGIAYEPWHYRYVGVEHAKEMQRLQLCLEEYLEFLETK